jgi:hypothetical protein
MTTIIDAPDIESAIEAMWTGAKRWVEGGRNLPMAFAAVRGNEFIPLIPQAKTKQMLYDMVNDFVERSNPDFLILVAESWILKIESDEPIEVVGVKNFPDGISEHPDATQCILLVKFFPAGQSNVTACDVDDQHGRRLCGVDYQMVEFDYDFIGRIRPWRLPDDHETSLKN